MTEGMYTLYSVDAQALLMFSDFLVLIQIWMAVTILQ